MAQTIEIKSVAEAQQQFTKLQTDARSNPALQNWGDQILLRPLLDGQQVRVGVVQPDGSTQNYQMWMYNGRLSVFSHDNVNSIYEREVLKGIIEPINTRINPITGGELKQVPKGEGWVNQSNPSQTGNFNVVSAYVGFDPRTNTAVVVNSLSEITSPLRGQKWWFQGGTDITPGKQFDIKDRMGVGETLTVGNSRYRLQTMVGYDDDRVAALQTQTGRVTDAFQQHLNQEPSMVITMPKAVFDQLPGNLVQKNPNPVQNPNLPGAAAVEKLNQVPATPTPAPPVTQQGISLPTAEVIVPITPQPAAPAAPNVTAQVPQSPSSNATNAAPTAQGLPADRLPIMYPPAQVTTRQEFEAAHNAVNAALQGIKMSYWNSVGDNDRMSKAQIEDVISRHEKAYPEFGKALRTAYNEMEKLTDKANGPAEVSNRATTELFNSYQEHRNEFQRARTPRANVERPDPAPVAGNGGAVLSERELAMFTAKPDNKGGTFVSASSFIGFVNKNPNVLSADQTEKVIKSYETAYPELGKSIREAYNEMKDAKTPEEREAAYKGVMDQIREFGGLKPRALIIDEARANQMYAAAQEPGFKGMTTATYNDSTGLRPIPDVDVAAELGVQNQVAANNATFKVPGVA